MSATAKLVRLFFENVDAHDQDPRCEVHHCTDAELAGQLLALADANGLQLAAGDPLYFARWLREFVNRPPDQDLIACPQCAGTAIEPISGAGVTPCFYVAVACRGCGWRS